MAFVYKRTVANTRTEVAFEVESFFKEYPELKWKFRNKEEVGTDGTRFCLANANDGVVFSRYEKDHPSGPNIFCFGGTGFTGGGTWPYHADSIDLSRYSGQNDRRPYKYPCYLHLLVTDSCLLIAQENFDDGYMQLYGAGSGCKALGPNSSAPDGIWVGGCGSTQSYHNDRFEFFSTKNIGQAAGGGGALLSGPGDNWQVMGLTGTRLPSNAVPCPALVHLKHIKSSSDYPLALYGYNEVKNFRFPLNSSMIFMPVYWIEKNAGGRYYPAWDIPYMKICATNGFKQGEIIQNGNEKWMVFDRGEVDGIGFVVFLEATT
ncbi:hypothetical protein [Photobacterium sanguinicancri]|uniref:Uncharacterized protein n=1 Tax=Photobacterium sanguinicancri TaxID=875932 RepID=A0AAW7Y7F4_9GAMM|nr:hypothetical protein [Photobacterium sanguinicancri]MDO6542823.1 hypothetical protein [Photobacterium sanguinicancri]